MSTDPNFDITSQGGYVNQLIVQVTGTESPTGSMISNQVNLIVNGQEEMAPAALDGFGGWKSLAALNVGSNTVAAVETINGVQQTSRAVTYDFVPQGPDVEFTNYAFLTNKAQQTLTGTVTSAGGSGVVVGRVLTISDDGAPVAQATVQQNGTWSAHATLPHLGLNHLTATMTDAAGNTGEGESNYTYTITPPTVALATAGGLTNQPQQLIGGTAASGDMIQLLDNGTAIDSIAVNASGTWIRQETLIAQGTNNIQAVDTNLAGNVGTSNTIAYTLDTLPPAVAITSAATSVRAASDTETVTGTAEVGSSVTVFDYGAPITGASVGADGRWSAQVPLHPGPNSLTAQATDAAGNVGLSNTVVDTLDTTPIASAAPAPMVPSVPAVPVAAPTPPVVAFGPAPQLNGTTATLTGTASDAVGVTGVEIFQGTTALGAAQVNADGTWSFSHDFGQGTYDDLTAVATDPAGLGATAQAAYDLVTGLSGRHSSGAVETLAADGSVASATTVAADGTIGAQTVANGDGTATSTGYENGQSLFSIGNDVMTGNGYRENFVFQPAMGHARITDFVVAGAGHDTITLSHQDFDNIAQVLHQTTMSHGSAVIHVSPDDTIRLAGVTKADLIQHRGDFAFTS